MSGSVNKVILVGNLGKDPETNVMPSGDTVVNLSVATSESWKDKTTGEKKERTEWHRVVIFNQHIAKVVVNYLKQGSKVYIEGQLETRKWTDQSGVEKYSTEVVLRPYSGELTMLDSKGQNDDTGDAPYSERQGMFEANGGSPKVDVDDTEPDAPGIEDEIPF